MRNTSDTFEKPDYAAIIMKMSLCEFKQQLLHNCCIRRSRLLIVTNDGIVVHSFNSEILIILSFDRDPKCDEQLFQRLMATMELRNTVLLFKCGCMSTDSK